MEEGFYHFNHVKIGKTTHGPKAAHNFTWYMGRKWACVAVFAVGLAIPRSDVTHQTAVVAKYAQQVENTSRKNARVADTFHIGLPHCLSRKEMEGTIKSFLWSLTKGGEAKAAAFLQGVDSGNVHFHVMMFDRDNDGRRVQKMSERGSTQRMRTLWRVVANNKLEEYGYDVRIDERSLFDRNQEKATERDVMQLASSEADLPQSDIDVESDMPVYTPQELIVGALTMDEDRRYLRSTRDAMEALKVDANDAREAAVAYAKYAAEQDKKADIYRNAALLAGDDLAPLTREDGSLKGIEISAFGIKWESRSRRRGKELKAEVALHEYREKEARSIANKNLEDAQQFRDRGRRSDEKANALEAKLAQMVLEYGEGLTIESTEAVLEESIRYQLKDISPEQVVSEFDAGKISHSQATRTLEILGAHEYLHQIEASEISM